MNEIEKPTIVVLTYNRLKSIQRLLHSLKKSVYPSDVRLIISIDNAIENENNDVIDYCKNLVWGYGPKEIVIQEKHLGIVNHVFKCLDLTEKYENIILLEDDHYVSTQFYKIVCEVLKFYYNEEKLFCFSLYNHTKNGYTNLPFIPIQEDNDVYFAQIGFTQGLLINKKQWEQFKTWYKEPQNQIIKESDNLHPSLIQLDKTGSEWFPKITKYLNSSNKFNAFPRVSLSVNFHDIGTHNTKQSNWYQIPLLREKRNCILKSFSDTIAIYDSFLELLPEKMKKLNNELEEYDFDIDLQCSKTPKNIKKKYLITTRKPKSFEKTFARTMKPLEQNIIENLKGEGIYLTKKTELKFSKIQEITYKRDLYYFFNEGLNSQTKILYFFIGFFSKIGII